MYSVVVLALVGGLRFFAARQQADIPGRLEADELAVEAANERLPAGERVRALSGLHRVDPARGAAVAEKLLRTPYPDLRLTAAWIRARGGDPAGESAFLEMLGDHRLSLGFRGIAAKRLARLQSAKAHSAIIELARRESEAVFSGKAAPEREGFRWGLLKALGSYARAEDLDIALDLYRATGLRAPGRPLGLFGRPEALPLLREALTRERNAGSVIEIELAIARSGGEDGIAFVRKLLRRAAQMGVVEGQIDLQKEDPLSGRLAGDLLWDFGAHASDTQFLADVVGILKPTVCNFCGGAWAAIARIGIQGHEAELVRLAETLGAGQTDQVLQVLAYNGAAASARALAKRMGTEPAAEAYIAAHEKGLDRKWFPLGGTEQD